jgi:hypothetical protein
MHDPIQHDTLALGQFMRFMANHIDTLFVMQRPTAARLEGIHISSFADSSFADPDDPRDRATKGAIHFFDKSPVMRGSHKTNRQSPSSNAAKMSAASAACHGTVWFRSLLVELGVWSVSLRAPFY